jgi:hypothetical protein
VLPVELDSDIRRSKWYFNLAVVLFIIFDRIS